MKSSHITTLEETTLLRRLLWLYHGHYSLYGDNGEMQCDECGLDYKRDEIELIEKHFNNIEMKRMLDFGVALKEKEDEGEKNKEN